MHEQFDVSGSGLQDQDGRPEQQDKQTLGTVGIDDNDNPKQHPGSWHALPSTVDGFDKLPDELRDNEKKVDDDSDSLDAIHVVDDLNQKQKQQRNMQPTER